MPPVIILFAKAPVSGRVKTRLQPPLDAEHAASLHIAFVNDMLTRLQAAGFVLELHTDIRTDVWAEAAVTTRLQHEGDLGLKMFHALDGALRRGTSQAMIVGTDAPTLPAEHLRALFSAETDVALGPAEDGGYYAISARRVHPAMFAGATWGHPTALERTVAACAACGLTTTIGSHWWDVDEPADLARLMNSTDLPRHTAEWRRRFWSGLVPEAYATTMAELTEGTKAPSVKLQTDTGEKFDLAQHKGKNVVLYFYPKADTPG